MRCLLSLKLGVYLTYRILKSGRDVRRLIFSRGGLHPCLSVHAAPVKTSAKQASVKGCRRTHNSPCAVHRVLLSYHPQFGEFITIAAGITQNIYPEYIFDLKCDFTTQKFGAPWHQLFPGCGLLSWTLSAPLNPFCLTRLWRCRVPDGKSLSEHSFYPKCFQYPFSVPFWLN